MSATHDEPLGFLLYRVMAALRPEVAAALKPLGLGLAEFVCMRVLATHPGLTSAELARDTNVSAQAMNQVLRALEDRGALSRADSTSSGRAMPAQLTRRGAALLRRADRAVESADRQILQRLTAEQRDQLKALLYAAGTP
jgi:DNA-binding MarR family transcriptional regulator